MILKKGMICNLLLLSLASAAMGNQSSSSVLGNTCMSSTAKSSNECVSITCQGNISQPTTTCCINATAQKTNYKDSIQECPPSSTSTGPTPVCSVNCTIRLSSLQSITTGSKMTPSQTMATPSGSFSWHGTTMPVTMSQNTAVLSKSTRLRYATLSKQEAPSRSPTPEPPREEEKKQINLFVLVGGAGGTALLLMLTGIIILQCVILCQKKKKKKQHSVREGRHRYDIQRTAGFGENLEVTNAAYVYHLPAERVTNHVQKVETSREEDKRNNQYQEVGITDYEHMYSKTVQFNASGTHDGCSQDKSQEKETAYAELSITTLESASVYTKISLKEK
ncbi:hypothetical protein GBAR_LOCUS29007 [Geodia barretti]|uniref:Uncharacterized protein n=1 Tax=Geodia barretti TaxID=519541 RepID=A0AA35XHZ1_GEOBA|nr:hypothetical protein GBAR_LOCUS29007 [Geodia barretti]